MKRGENTIAWLVILMWFLIFVGEYMGWFDDITRALGG